MAEFKPRRDDEMAGEKTKAGTQEKPVPSPETKPHGDKLQDVFEDKDRKGGKPG